ncbi:N-acetylmannosamine kinase [Vibrio sp. SS-MA-C1-2]|uniref:N-acetylmannosamine kinase n=1 Tax=Vibrio sp. SS-MA-C1-2 TaxID=2908646 RepID=UPI001F3B2DA1|nr:N-acetylmannosamine kinase [Vibrio sp. SS-MA-C1-2]UJF17917.1 N-acetylmannosamine kinase [Vibrio sp. SS-MA-C1-2]
MKILAIDIGGTKVAYGIIENGQLLSREQFATPKTVTIESFNQLIIENCKHEIDLCSEIRISTTGLVTSEGISAINPVTLPFPAPFPLAKKLKETTKIPVFILNDAQAATWFEYQQLTIKAKNMAYVTVSTGVGGGLIIDHQLQKGAGGLAGHIGHMVIEQQGERCGCGRQGCVEVIASGTAIHKQAQQVFGEQISNIQLFEMLESDQKAFDIIQNSAKAIATLCCNLKASLDLDLIVIGGGIGLANGYLQLVQKEITKQPHIFQVKTISAQGGHDACLLGAASYFDSHLTKSNL